MNAEELKQLKKGDEIFIRARFVNVLGDGDVLFSHSATNSYDKVVREESYTQPKNVIIPPHATKYDSCRRFKKGDKVRLVTCNGRPPYDRFNEDEYVPDETIFSVMSDERICGCVDLYEKTPKDGFQVHHTNLELVTPAEELEPYFVMELKGGYGVYNTRFQPETEACHYWNEMHPHAKEAAEAECARLNAEHRKERE